MACVCVGYSGEELVFVNKPHRRISKNEFFFDENTIEDIVEMAEKCVRKSVEDAKNLIEDVQPKDLI